MRCFDSADRLTRLWTKGDSVANTGTLCGQMNIIALSREDIFGVAQHREILKLFKISFFQKMLVQTF